MRVLEIKRRFKDSKKPHPFMCVARTNDYCPAMGGGKMKTPERTSVAEVIEVLCKKKNLFHMYRKPSCDEDAKK